MRVKFAVLIYAITAVYLGTSLAFAQDQQEIVQKAKEYFAAGRKFINQGNYTAADNEFKKAQQLLGAASASQHIAPVNLKAKPEAAKAQTTKTETQAKAAELAKDPVSYYTKEIKLSPKNADLYFNLACEYIKIDEYKLAEEEFKRVIQLNHRDKDACYNLAVLYENYLSDRKLAVLYYSRYVGIAPRAQDAWRVRVWIKDLKKQLNDEK